eukprot:CAMPEP_0195538264 /NCGR_PEP_ID=MMETSP0794_2-20130614/49436_1 /TAXON_ID=515487 /ORGANISM="Stephanopyxis turris, Strain CCMP 815" /LENGTH=254 /DNA_ID=CAMNT_0040672233 /DNA_START=108 /DNA_END=872 /DNA_ORIENTATION=-
MVVSQLNAEVSLSEKNREGFLRGATSVKNLLKNQGLVHLVPDLEGSSCYKCPSNAIRKKTGKYCNGYHEDDCACKKGYTWKNKNCMKHSEGSSCFKCPRNGLRGVKKDKCKYNLKNDCKCKRGYKWSGKYCKKIYSKMNTNEPHFKINSNELVSKKDSKKDSKINNNESSNYYDHFDESSDYDDSVSESSNVDDDYHDYDYVNNELVSKKYSKKDSKINNNELYSKKDSKININESSNFHDHFDEPSEFDVQTK